MPRQQQQSTTGYRNPFRHAPVQPSRIDQGVDYAGRPGDPIYALGPGVVDQVFGGNSGWPGGGWVSYRLTSGPARGQRVFVAEDVAPAVSVGQKVDSSTVVARFNQLGSIETGWAGPLAQGDQTLAWYRNESQKCAGCDPGRYSTLAGVTFSNLLASLGAPAGLLTPGGIRGRNGKIVHAKVTATTPGGVTGVTTAASGTPADCLIRYPSANPLSWIGVTGPSSSCLFSKPQARGLVGGLMIVVLALPVSVVGVGLLAAAGFRRTGVLGKASDAAAVVPGPGQAVSAGLAKAQGRVSRTGDQARRARKPKAEPKPKPKAEGE